MLFSWDFFFPTKYEFLFSFLEDTGIELHGNE